MNIESRKNIVYTQLRPRTHGRYLYNNLCDKDRVNINNCLYKLKLLDQSQKKLLHEKIKTLRVLKR